MSNLLNYNQLFHQDIFIFSETFIRAVKNGKYIMNKPLDNYLEIQKVITSSNVNHYFMRTGSSSNKKFYKVHEKIQIIVGTTSISVYTDAGVCGVYPTKLKYSLDTEEEGKQVNLVIDIIDGCLSIKRVLIDKNKKKYYKIPSNINI